MADRLVSDQMISGRDVDLFAVHAPAGALLLDAFKRQAAQFIEKRAEVKGEGGVFMIRMEWDPEAGMPTKHDRTPQQSIRRRYCLACGTFIGTGDMCDFKCRYDAEEVRPPGTVAWAVYELRALGTEEVNGPKKFDGEVPRDTLGIACTCKGFAERVECTPEEQKTLSSCVGGCCSRAFVCKLCGQRWVGKAVSPEMSED